MSEKFMEENQKEEKERSAAPAEEAAQAQEASAAADDGSLCVSSADVPEEEPSETPEGAEDFSKEQDTEKKKRGNIFSALLGSFHTKYFKYGMYSTSLTAAVIVLVIAVNVLAHHLPGSLNNLDLSEADIYSVGEQTQELLQSLDQEVTIRILSSEEASDENISRLLSEYRRGSKKISIQYVDTEKDPAAAASYGDYSANSLIVSGQKGETVIDYYDIYQTDYSSYYTSGTASTSFDGEGQITSAIYKVALGEALSVYTLTGHGESQLGSGVSSMIAKQNMTVTDLNLMASEIPEDCDAVIINGPVRDLGSEEADRLVQYLSQGGSVVVLLSYTDASMTNLSRVLGAYEVQMEPGIVMETSGNCVSYPINVLPQIVSSEITQKLASEKANILFTNAIGLRASDSDSVTVTTLLSSSDGAYAKVPENGSFATLEKAAGDKDGPFRLAVLAEDGTKGGQLVVISSETILEDGIVLQYPVENLTFFMNCLTAVCSQQGLLSSVSIEPKSLDIEYLTIPALHQMVWFFVCVILIPLGVFVFGLVIWLIRRKK